MKDEPKDMVEAKEMGWWGKDLGGISNTCKDPHTPE